MIRKFGLFTFAILLAIAGAFLAWPTSAFAQQGIQSSAVQEINVDRVDVREALRTLFRQVSVSYSISPEVQGNVTVHLRNVSFDLALRAILEQVNATCRIEEGIYQIVPTQRILFHPSDRGSDPIVIRAEPSEQTQVLTVDDKFMYLLKGQALYKVNKSDLRTVSSRLLGK
jgi:type II secretory pathway component GspD/PulD (secretin)